MDMYRKNKRGNVSMKFEHELKKKKKRKRNIKKSICISASKDKYLA